MFEIAGGIILAVVILALLPLFLELAWLLIKFCLLVGLLFGAVYIHPALGLACMVSAFGWACWSMVRA